MQKKEEVFNEAEERDKEIKSRIDSLYGISDKPVNRTSEMTEEEKKTVKKRMVFLIWFCLIMSGLIILNIINPITKLFEKDKTVVEKKESIADLPSGDVDVENKEIQTMVNIFKFDPNNPLYETNIIKLFDGDKELNQMDFELQMFLLTSNAEFNEYLYKNTKLKDYNPSAEQNLNIIITTEKLNELANKVFNNNIEMQFQNFKYYYNFGVDGIQYFDVVLNEGTYTFVPVEPITESAVTVYFKPVSASNIDNEIYIRSNVLFVKDNCIYGSKNMQNCLNTNMEAIDNYYLKGTAIEFVFDRLVDDISGQINYKFKGIFAMNTN